MATMHPIQGDRARLAIYLIAWLLLGVVASVLMPGDWPQSVALMTPIFLLYSLLCLAVWYPCRATPLRKSSRIRLVGVHLTGALVAAGLCLALGSSWARALARWAGLEGSERIFHYHAPILFVVSVLLYLLAAAVHYLLLAFEESRRAESRSLELKALARQAELEAFKTQIDPHFLFNCLNSISSLCGSDPEAARQAAIRLGELLRASLRLAADDEIPLAEELALSASYLEVEKVRFGDRLSYRESVSKDCLNRRVPALMLQPLLENALKHGIAHRVEGGEVVVSGECPDGTLRLSVSNPCDPERPAADGQGIGLKNVRSRLDLLYGGRARFAARDLGSEFRVEIQLPAEPLPAADEVTP